MSLASRRSSPILTCHVVPLHAICHLRGSVSSLEHDLYFLRNAFALFYSAVKLHNFLFLLTPVGLALYVYSRLVIQSFKPVILLF